MVHYYHDTCKYHCFLQLRTGCYEGPNELMNLLLTSSIMIWSLNLIWSVQDLEVAGTRMDRVLRMSLVFDVVKMFLLCQIVIRFK